MGQGTIQRVIAIIQEAFLKLNLAIPMKDLEDIAVLVHRAMTLRTRHFHTLEHVFSFTSDADPIQSLASLFHDIVYYQVDEGFIPEIQTIIAPYIQQSETAISIIPQIPQEDRNVWLTLEVFNLHPGQALSTTNGLNEFLSALVMVQKLQKMVSDHDLIRMVVCIEATIPFQGKNERNESHFDILEKRLIAINKKYQCCLRPSEIESVLQLAVTFSNKDVENFCEKDAGRFLDMTWKLLPETNVALRAAEIYSIREYRQALDRMERFFIHLDPETVFNQYHGIPPRQQFNRMVRQTHKNVLTARVYLRIKLLAASILEALADISGGDAPLSLFTGDRSKNQEPTNRYHDFLSEPVPSQPESRDPTLYRLFFQGRPGSTSFDPKTSPLSLFLYTTLSMNEIDHLVELAKSMFAKQIDPKSFLFEFPRPVMIAVVRACAATVVTRSERLTDFIRSL